MAEVGGGEKGRYIYCFGLDVFDSIDKSSEILPCRELYLM